MGTPIIVSEGTPLVRLASHTYWVMPLYLLVQAAWVKVVGCTLLASRSISVLAGLGAPIAMFVGVGSSHTIQFRRRYPCFCWGWILISSM